MNLAEQTVVAHLDADRQRSLAVEARAVATACRLLIRPTAGRRPMSVRIANAGALGWVADEKGYRYTETHPGTGSPWPAIPDGWLDLATEIAGAHPWDCAHLVWYTRGATLGWHRDKTERDKTRPIVTVSLGDSASWAVRLVDGDPVHRTMLRSGDVTLLADELRSALHKVERIDPADALLAPSPLRGPGRLAISIRCAR